ncbi:MULTISPECIES: GtrA family protein [unclassified Pedobacter]|uniref:GtrA family protein n=1 Tax=Pedobacter TaxID=84567 RepID=UPI000B4BE404|nr:MULTISPECIES: GtrA family protein [unclassified Pedobacter]MCX2430742.1 GtrA family protein [Pedobacter sp. GR22-10]MCX2584057.1 GtrA family protein [Pedobacter sp. MR22-3]OWK69658.1 polysaccharide biosynthesis protein GtrA [Pedobacter sp. AJM]
MSKKKSILVFLKAQVAAFAGGVTDYGLMILFTEMLGIHFTISILLSGTLGGIVNFCINRFWAFNDGAEYVASPKKQLIKFAVVVLGSISLKSAGTYLLQKFFNLDYRIGRLLIDSLVSYGFNYPMMKFWVFKTQVMETVPCEYGNTNKLINQR